MDMYFVTILQYFYMPFQKHLILYFSLSPKQEICINFSPMRLREHHQRGVEEDVRNTGWGEVPRKFVFCI